MSATTEKVLELFGSRLDELDAEKARINNAIEALGMNGNGPRRPRPGPKGPKRQKRRRNTRIDQALKIIAEEPGITAGAIAKAMKIKPNYLYRVLGELEKESRVKKAGRAFFPAVD